MFSYSPLRCYGDHIDENDDDDDDEDNGNKNNDRENVISDKITVI